VSVGFLLLGVHSGYQVDTGGASAGDTTHVTADWDKVDSADPVQTYASGFTLASGDAVVVGAWSESSGAGGTAATATVTDNLGNTYTQVEQIDDSTTDARAATFVAKNVTGGSNLTITVTWSAGSPAKKVLAFHVVHGVHLTTPVVGNAAQAQASPGTGTDAVSSGATTPSADKAYVFGFTVALAYNGTVTQGTGFTFDNNGGFAAGTHGAYSEHLIQTTAASVAATFTDDTSTNNIITMMVALQPA
jgi:hypothetical protein